MSLQFFSSCFRMINFEESIELQWHIHFIKKKRVGFRLILISGIFTKNLFVVSGMCLNWQQQVGIKNFADNSQIILHIQSPFKHK